jgi:hypothetical protein
MDGYNNQAGRADFGEIVVGDEELLRLRHPAAARPFRATSRAYTWLPAAWMRDQTPPDFSLPLRCVTGPDELRRIWPAGGWETFLELASGGGLAVLCRRQNLNKAERYSYRAMRFLFRRARRMSEFFAPSFRHGRDLFIVRSARTDPEEKDVLPPDVGLDERGRGERWSVRELTRRGAEAARDAGWARPTREQRIQFGLLEAARPRPLSIPAAKVPTLIRSALFDVSPTFDELDPALIDMVTERTLEALRRHLGDDSPRFDSWFGGPHSSFVHQIAKKKRSRGGALAEDQVREALLHLGWQAYRHMANCLHAQMRTVQNASPLSLTTQERLVFEHTYLRQPYLGDLPLALLMERFGFLKGVLSEMWDRLPDTSAAPVFHRLLDYYSVMAVRRREIDRLRKSGRPRPFVEAAYVPSARRDLFQEIADCVRETRRVACGCPRPEWRAELMSGSTAKITILHMCVNCNLKGETTLSRDEFARFGR